MGYSVPVWFFLAEKTAFEGLTLWDDPRVLDRVASESDIWTATSRNWWHLHALAEATDNKLDLREFEAKVFAGHELEALVGDLAQAAACIASEPKLAEAWNRAEVAESEVPHTVDSGEPADVEYCCFVKTLHYAAHRALSSGFALIYAAAQP